MTDKEKIREEIGRTMESLMDCCEKRNEVKLAVNALENLLNFINSLPEEPVCPCEECAAISINCKDVCCKFKKFTKENKPKEPESEDLEKAAKKYGTKKHPMTTIGANESAYDFKSGAQWQKNKLIKWLTIESDHLIGELKKGNKDYGQPEQYRAKLYKEVVNKIKDE